MDTARLERISPLSGALAAILMGIASALIGIYDYLPPAERLVEAFSQNANGLMGSGYLGLLSAFLLMWFAGSLYRTLGRAEGSDGWLAPLALGGGIASGVTLALGFSALVSTGARAGAQGGITPIGAVTLYDYYSQVLGGMFGFTMAIFVVTPAIISRRAGLLPAWFDWVSIALAVTLITPFSYIFLLGALLWQIIVSIWLFRRVSAEASAGTGMAQGQI